MRAIPTLKISISGVRGVVGDSLTPGPADPVLAGLRHLHRAPGASSSAATPRTSGEMVRQAVVAGPAVGGLPHRGRRRLSDADRAAARADGCARAGGIAITASHNPPEWNALKFVGPDALFLSGARGRELLDIYHQGDYTKARSQRIRHGRGDGRRARPARRRGDRRARRRCRRRRGGCGSCSTRATAPGRSSGPRLLEALGAEVIGINTTPDGRFPRPAEPTPENLAALCAAVREHRADIGFAQDMDADRLAIVSERGVPIGEERTLVLAVEHVLGRTPGPVVANLATTHALEPVAGALRVRGVPDAGRRGERDRGDAALQGGHRRRGQRRRDLPADQLRARQPGRDGARPAPARGVGPDRVGAGRRRFRRSRW